MVGSIFAKEEELLAEYQNVRDVIENVPDEKWDEFLKDGYDIQRALAYNRLIDEIDEFDFIEQMRYALYMAVRYSYETELGIEMPHIWFLSEEDGEPTDEAEDMKNVFFGQYDLFMSGNMDAIHKFMESMTRE